RRQRVFRLLGHLDRHLLVLAFTEDGHLHVRSRRRHGDRVSQLLDGLDRLAVELRDDIRRLEFAVRRRPGEDLLHEYALLPGEADALGFLAILGDIDDLDAQPAARDLALLAKDAVDLLGLVRRDGKADPLEAAGTGGDGGVDADDLAAQVYQRAAG